MDKLDARTMNTDSELSVKCRKTTEKISENVHIIANDPSLAFYRIQEHVRKVLPAIAEKRYDVMQLQSNLLGHCYDMEYDVSALKDLENSDGIFKNIQDMMKTAIFLKQQLKYEESNKASRKESQNSVYKRFSDHMTLDISDLPDFYGVMRETSYRMENIMSTRTAHSSHSELQRSHTTLH